MLKQIWHKVSGTLSSEAAAPAAEGEIDVAPTPLGMLITRQILRDGEVVLLTRKPSIWSVPLECLRFAAAVLILMIAVHLYGDSLPGHGRILLEVGAFALGARLMVAVLVWMGRLYVLTNLRVLQLSGVFNQMITDCPLRKVARVRVIHTLKERLGGTGSVEIIPFDEEFPVSLWQTVRRPRAVHKTIVDAVRRAKQGEV